MRNVHKSYAKYDFQVNFIEIWEIYVIKMKEIVLSAAFVHLYKVLQI